MEGSRKLADFPNGKVGRWLHLGATLFVTCAVVPLIAWVIHIEAWKAHTESSRFTLRDWQQEKSLILLQMQEVDRRINNLDVKVARLPDEVPPPWFKQEVDELRARLREIERRVGR